MDIDDRIRSRIEAILTNDARNEAEIRKMATEDDPIDPDPFGEERNLYQRIINNYRSAVSEVNSLLEANVGFLSGFYRIVETIKEKENFQEICSRILEHLLENFGAEYCGLAFRQQNDRNARDIFIEGVREDRRFLWVHSSPGLLGSAEFEETIARLAADSSEALNIEDVYKDPRFDALDFPSVVRSLVCLPIILRSRCVGALVLSHSLPHFFNDNHLRVLRILASMVAHLKFLAAQDTPAIPAAPLQGPAADEGDVFSVVLLHFENAVPSLQEEAIQDIRRHLAPLLGAKEAIFFHEEKELLVLLPGISSEALPARVQSFQHACESWRSAQRGRLRSIQVSVGFSTCEGGQSLSRTLEVASLVMHPILEEEFDIAG